MIYKFIDDNEAEITVNSLSSLQELVDSQTIKENTKVKAGLRGKWIKAKELKELKFKKKKVEKPAKKPVDVESFITREPIPLSKKEKIKEEEAPRVDLITPIKTEESIEETEVKSQTEIIESEDLSKEVEEEIITADDKNQTATKEGKEKQDKDFFIKVLWRGDYSLKQSFWALYLLPMIIFSLFIFLLLPTVLRPTADAGVTIIYYLIVFAGIFYSILSMVGTWKSANKHTNKKKLEKKPYGWAITAQIIIISDVISRLVNIANIVNE